MKAYTIHTKDFFENSSETMEHSVEKSDVEEIEIKIGEYAKIYYNWPEEKDDVVYYPWHMVQEWTTTEEMEDGQE